MKMSRFWFMTSLTVAIPSALFLSMDSASSKEDAKPDTKAEAKVENKVDSKTTAKAEVKTDSKSEAKSDSKAEPKSEEKTEAAAESHPTVHGDNVCFVDEKSLGDMKKLKAQIETKSKEIAARESEFQAKERALEEELKRLQDLRDEINKLRQAVAKENEEKVGKLVETYEGMGPKNAAQVLASIDQTLAVAVMSRISTAKLSKIMNVMDPEKSTRLTEALAGVVRTKQVASRDASPSTEMARKGGDDGNRKQQSASSANSDSGNTGSINGREPSSQKGQK